MDINWMRIRWAILILLFMACMKFGNGRKLTTDLPCHETKPECDSVCRGFVHECVENDYSKDWCCIKPQGKYYGAVGGIAIVVLIVFLIILGASCFFCPFCPLYYRPPPEPPRLFALQPMPMTGGQQPIPVDAGQQPIQTPVDQQSMRKTPETTPPPPPLPTEHDS